MIGVAGRQLFTRSDERQKLFGTLFVVGLINGFASDVFWSVTNSGAFEALGTTCHISVIVWGAALAASVLVFSGPGQCISSRDRLAAGAAMGTFLIPSSLVSWLGLSGLSLYVALSSARASPLWRGAMLFSAITVPMFWTRHLFPLLEVPIVNLDGALVGWVTGLPRVGNVLSLADGRRMYIGAGCSSIANMSLTLLCWSAFRLWRGGAIRAVDFCWCGAACILVMSVNVGRIAAIGIHPDKYELLHGRVGSTVASWVSLVLSVGISAIGTRNAAGSNALRPHVCAVCDTRA